MTYETRNLSLAAYLMEIGRLDLLSCGKDRRTGDFQFVFDDPETKAEGLAIAWTNSDERRFEGAVMALKAKMRSGQAVGS